MSQFKFSTGTKINPILALLVAVVFMFSLFWLAKGVFTILSFAFPVMLIATAIINYRVLLGFGKWVLNALKINPAIGIVIILFTIFAYPIVGLFLLFKALGTRGVKGDPTDAEEPIEGEYIKFEKVEEDDFLDLSELKKSKEKIQNNYNDLF